MRIVPGQYIPLWFRLFDGNPSRYVLAHLTDVAGVEQPGSPFALTYSENRGIYTGVGPVMGSNILIADYTTYLDSAFTQLDNSYLPAADWIEPNLSSGGSTQLVFLNTPIIGTISPNKMVGTIACEVEASGTLQQDKLIGLIRTPLLTGSVSTPEIEEYL